MKTRKTIEVTVEEMAEAPEICPDPENRECLCGVVYLRRYEADFSNADEVGRLIDLKLASLKDRLLEAAAEEMEWNG